MDSQQGRPQIRMSFGGPLSPTVRTLIWINGIVYLFLVLVRGRQMPDLFVGSVDTQGLLIHLLGLVPRSVTHDLALWQPLTYMFLHQEFWHLLLNMLGLWWFGGDVERHMGSGSFLRYYLLTGVAGALAAIGVSWDSAAVTIGASGAVFGLLVAYGFLFPNRVIYLYFVVPVRAIWCIAIFAAITLYSLWTGASDGVSHIAHLGGMAFGIGWFGLARYRTGFVNLLKEVRKRRLRRKLRLIRRGGPDDEPPADTPYDNPTIH